MSWTGKDARRISTYVIRASACSPDIFRGGWFGRNKVPVANSPSLNRIPKTSHENSPGELIQVLHLGRGRFVCKAFPPGANPVETFSRHKLTEPRHPLLIFAV
jgi:hypothetical protein